MLISNLSQRLGSITKHLYRNRALVRACESRRNQKQVLPLTATAILDIVRMIKGVLRVNIPVGGVTSGLPKFRKKYGNGGLIIAATKVQIFSNTSKIIFRECKVIQRRELTTLNLETGFEKLIRNSNNKFYYDKICSPDILIQAYGFISKNKNSNTPGVCSKTLDGYSKDTIHTVSKSLKDHSFKFKPIRRIEIPKPDGSTRLLGILNPRDKVVQKVMAMALEEIYESKFSNNSHGFRPKRSSHSALKYVTKWTGTKWFIEGDISKCFDTLDHCILEQLLKKEVKSKPFIDLYWKAVKAHYINPVNKSEEFSKVGVSQGGTLSPILSNIYLHEFDKFMEIKVQESKKTGRTTISNPKYKKVHTKISNMRQYFLPSYKRNRSLSEKQEKARIKDILKLEKIRSKYPSTIQGPGYRVYYVRYADDFLIGINGSYRMAEKFKTEIQIFLLEKLKLNLNLKKTKITRSDKGVYFLGARLKRHTSRTNDQKRRSQSFTKIGRKVRARVPQGNIIALVSITHLIQKLQSQGICRIKHIKKHNVIPTRKTAWVNLTLVEIITRYNNVWRGLLNYYSFAYNRCQLNYVQYLLHHSLACTFMNKLKLNSRKQVFQKYGKTITVKAENGKRIFFKLEKSLARINKFSSTIFSSAFEIFNYSIRTRSVFDKACKICGTKRIVEMHHRRPLKAHKTDNTLKGIKINLSRKQIPLCHSCHQRVHNGLYDGPGIY
jgi:group II intron reverse transcriptase/maturase